MLKTNSTEDDAGHHIFIDRARSALCLRNTQTNTIAQAIEILRSRSNSASGNLTFANDIEAAVASMRSISSAASPWE